LGYRPSAARDIRWRRTQKRHLTRSAWGCATPGASSSLRQTTCRNRGSDPVESSGVVRLFKR
jgi:hypothetical protein